MKGMKEINIDVLTVPQTKKGILNWSWKLHSGLRPIFFVSYLQVSICAVYCWYCFFKRDVTLNKGLGPMHWQHVNRDKLPIFMRPFYPKHMRNPELEYYLAVTAQKK